MQPIVRINGDSLEPEDFAAERDARATSDVFRQHDTPPAWERYDRPSPRRLERWVKAEDALLDELEAVRPYDAEIARRVPRHALDVDEVSALFADVVGDNPSQMEIELLGTLAMMIWGKDPRKGRQRLTRKSEERPRFPSLAAALEWYQETAYPDLGVGCPWESTRDGTRLRNLGEDSETTRLERAALVVRGRRKPATGTFEVHYAGGTASASSAVLPRGAGFLPANLTYVRGTSRSQRAEAAGVSTMHTKWDVGNAIRAAGCGHAWIAVALRDVRTTDALGRRVQRNMEQVLAELNADFWWRRRHPAELTMEQLRPLVSNSRKALRAAFEEHALIPWQEKREKAAPAPRAHIPTLLAAGAPRLGAE